MTMYDMQSILTIRLDDDLDQLLGKVCERSGRNRSEIVREALRRQLAVAAFEQLRTLTMPFAERKGFLTDEDVFEAIS